MKRNNNSDHAVSQPLDTGHNIFQKEEETSPVKCMNECGGLTDTKDVSTAPQGFLFTSTPDVHNRLILQLGQSFSDWGTADLGELVRRSVAVLNGIDPQDQVEAMLATQMIATHDLAMVLITNASRGDNSVRLQHYTELANKTLRTFTSQVEALGRYRNKGRQKIVVEHVTVNEGGQAIVGSEIVRGGGDKQ